MGADGSPGGMVPSQWFVRMMALAMSAGLVAAVVASWSDIKRYVHIERM